MSLPGTGLGQDATPGSGFVRFSHAEVQQALHVSRAPISSPLTTVTTQGGLRSNVDAESRVLHPKSSYR